MTVKLYDHPLSPYSQKIKIALTEKGVPFELELPTALGSGQTPHRFLSASPRGEVPALLDDETKTFDSSVILHYVEERWPEPALLPAGAAERARARMIEEVMDTHFEAITWALREVITFGRGEGEALGEQLVDRATTELHQWFSWLEAQLGEALWFGGDSFGWADLCVAPFVNGAALFAVAPAGALGAWLQRTNERPSVSACQKAVRDFETASATPSLAPLREAIEQGLFKREYRDHRLEWMVKAGGLEVVRNGLEKDNIRFNHPFEA